GPSLFERRMTKTCYRFSWVLAIFADQSILKAMFKKLVGIEPLDLITSAEEKLHDFAEEVILYRDIPKDANEIAERISDADAVLLSYTSTLDAKALEKCPNVVYIGMCCSLYSPETANVDIHYADQRGIKVTGIRDYGDEGVVEYVIRERSEEHTSELQSRENLVCRLLLEKKNKITCSTTEDTGNSVLSHNRCC